MNILNLRTRSSAKSNINLEKCNVLIGYPSDEKTKGKNLWAEPTL